MAKRINVDIGKAMKVAGKYFSKVGKEIMANKDKILLGAFLTTIVDNIKTHIEKDAVEKAYEKDSVKYQSITRKNEAKIRALKEQADRSAKVEERIQQLEQVVQEKLKERSGNE